MVRNIGMRRFKEIKLTSRRIETSIIELPIFLTKCTILTTQDHQYSQTVLSSTPAESAILWSTPADLAMVVVAAEED
ncbi:hypothetical protein LXL04_011454 [Taraxacum kok-saghyz]